MSKVSVLVAAYNVKEYISEAMASVVAQTLKDIEIVVVDDCSTDGTFEIIQKYAALDSRIKVTRHKENSGILRTRRDGFLNSTGDYIMFLDGDDTLAPNACEKAYNAITKEKVDMLEFNFDVSFTHPSDNDVTLERNFRNDVCSTSHKVVSISKAGVLDSEETGCFISFQLWNKIYKRTVIENAVPHLPDEYLNMADDVFFSFFMQYYVHTYNYIADRLYVYKFGCGMSTTDKLSDKLMNSLAKMAYVYHTLCDFAKENGIETKCKAALRTVFTKTYSSIVGNYFNRVPKSQKKEFVSAVMNYGTAEDLILALSEHLYSYLVPQERIADECAALDIFASTKAQAKTIGIYYFRVYNGGVENVISTLSDMWVKQGYKIVLFTDEEPNKDDYYINPAIKRVVIPAMKSRDFENRKERIEAFRAAIFENNIDVMVYNAWVSNDLVFDEMIIKSCGVNLIIHTHNLFCCEVDNSDGYYAHFFSVLPRLYAFVDSVIAISDVDAAWWSAMGYRVFKTINPIQFDLKTPTAPLNGNNILVVARISAEKQVLDAIKIAEQVKKEIPDVQLTIVGKGDDQGYINQVNEYIKTNDLDELVNMPGFTLDMLRHYQSADIMLSTSRYEGCPLSWLEGKVCGLPLVCYEIPSLDIVRDGKGVVVIDQLDYKAAAAAIVKILRDPELKKKLGSEARESAENFYTVDLTERWKEIFEQTLLPKPERIPTYKLPVSDAVMRIALNKYDEGILKRTHMATANANSARCADLEAQCRALESQIAALRRSESFRIGAAIAFFPRVIKLLLKKIFRR